MSRTKRLYFVTTVAHMQMSDLNTLVLMIWEWHPPPHHISCLLKWCRVWIPHLQSSMHQMRQSHIKKQNQHYKLDVDQLMCCDTHTFFGHILCPQIRSKNQQRSTWPNRCIINILEQLLVSHEVLHHIKSKTWF